MTEILSETLLIPNSLSWSASSGHSTVTLTQDIRNFKYVIATVGLFVESYSPGVTHPSWQNTAIWTNDMIEEAYQAGINNWEKYMGILPNILPGDPEKTLENIYFSWHIAFGLSNATTLRINQSVVTGWSSDTSNKVKLISVKGYK